MKSFKKMLHILIFHVVFVYFKTSSVSRHVYFYLKKSKNAKFWELAVDGRSASRPRNITHNLLLQYFLNLQKFSRHEKLPSLNIFSLF